MNAPQTILELVQAKLPFLTDADLPVVSSYTAEMMALLQRYLKMPDDGLFEEASYTFLQRSLISDLVALHLLWRRSVAAASGSAGVPSAATGGWKSATVGDLKVEFDTSKTTVSGFGTNLTAMTDQLRSDACMKAQQLGFGLCFDECGKLCLSEIEGGPVPFIVVRPTRNTPGCAF